MISGVKKNFKARVFKTNSTQNPPPNIHKRDENLRRPVVGEMKQTANLDFSEEAVSGSHHDNIMGGQGLPTNQDGTQANTDFSPEAIKGSSVSQIGSGDPNLRKEPNVFNASDTFLGNGGGNDSNIFSAFFKPAYGATPTDDEGKEVTPTPMTPPPPPQVPTETTSPEDYGFSQGYQDADGTKIHNVDSGFTISNNFFATSNSTPSNSRDLFSSPKMSNDQYKNTLALQTENNKSNVSNMAGWENMGNNNKSQYSNMKPEDFFKGTKSGNMTSNPFTMEGSGMTRDNKPISGSTNSYSDVNPFGSDSFNLPEFSNEKKNKKALKDQFDLYSGF